MLYNKRKVEKTNDKKLLHKISKHWVVISLSTLALLGGSTAVVSANSTVQQNINQPNIVNQNDKNSNKNNGSQQNHQQFNNELSASSSSKDSVSSVSSVSSASVQHSSQAHTPVQAGVSLNSKERDINAKDKSDSVQASSMNAFVQSARTQAEDWSLEGWSGNASFANAYASMSSADSGDPGDMFGGPFYANSYNFSSDSSEFISDLAFDEQNGTPDTGTANADGEGIDAYSSDYPNMLYYYTKIQKDFNDMNHMVNKPATDTIEYTYNGSVIKSESFSGTKGKRDNQLATFNDAANHGVWKYLPKGYNVRPDALTEWNAQASNDGLSDGWPVAWAFSNYTIKIPVVPTKSLKINFHDIYSNVDGYSNDVPSSLNKSGDSDITGPYELSSNDILSPSGNIIWTFVDNQGNPITAPSFNYDNNTHDVNIAPIYKGLVYKYNSNNNSVEFTHGYADNNLSTFLKDSPFAKVSSIKFNDGISTSNTTNMGHLLAYDENLSSIYGLNNLRTTHVDTMIGMFMDDTNLKSIDMSSLDASNLSHGNSPEKDSTGTFEGMPGIFHGDTALTDVKLSHNLDTTNLFMPSAFVGDNNIKSISAPDTAIFTTDNSGLILNNNDSWLSVHQPNRNATLGSNSPQRADYDTYTQQPKDTVTDTFNFKHGNNIIKSIQQSGKLNSQINVESSVPSQYNEHSNTKFTFDGKNHDIELGISRPNGFNDNVKPHVNPQPRPSHIIIPQMTTDVFEFKHGDNAHSSLVSSVQLMGRRGDSIDVSSLVPSQYNVNSGTKFSFDGGKHIIYLGVDRPNNSTIVNPSNSQPSQSQKTDSFQIRLGNAGKSSLLNSFQLRGQQGTSVDVSPWIPSKYNNHSNTVFTLDGNTHIVYININKPNKPNVPNKPNNVPSNQPNTPNTPNKPSNEPKPIVPNNKPNQPTVPGKKPTKPSSNKPQPSMPNKEHDNNVPKRKHANKRHHNIVKPSMNKNNHKHNVVKHRAKAQQHKVLKIKNNRYSEEQTGHHNQKATIGKVAAKRIKADSNMQNNSISVHKGEHKNKLPQTNEAQNNSTLTSIVMTILSTLLGFADYDSKKRKE